MLRWELFKCKMKRKSIKLIKALHKLLTLVNCVPTIHKKNSISRWYIKTKSLILGELKQKWSMYINQQDAQSLLWLDFIFQRTLYMFRTVSFHLQEQSFYKLYVVFDIGVYDIQLIKWLLLKMEWYSPKYVQRILKNKV